MFPSLMSWTRSRVLDSWHSGFVWSRGLNRSEPRVPSEVRQSRTPPLRRPSPSWFSPIAVICTSGPATPLKEFPELRIKLRKHQKAAISWMLSAEQVIRAPPPKGRRVSEGELR